MEVKIGKVTHYYNRIGVAVVQLKRGLAVGERILVLGKTTEFTQVVNSMEIEHRKVQSVPGGTEVAVQVAEPARRGDSVYKIVDDEQA